MRRHAPPQPSTRHSIHVTNRKILEFAVPGAASAQSLAGSRKFRAYTTTMDWHWLAAVFGQLAPEIVAHCHQGSFQYDPYHISRHGIPDGMSEFIGTHAQWQLPSLWLQPLQAEDLVVGHAPRPVEQPMPTLRSPSGGQARTLVDH